MLAPNIPQIDKRNWYWIVETNPSLIYSSATNSYVPTSFGPYTTWLNDGNIATKIADESMLWSSVADIFPDIVFDGTTSFIQPTPTTFTKDQLKDYAALKRYTKETSGITVGNNFIATDRTSQSMISSIMNLAVNDSTFTTKWKSSRGKFVNLNATAIINAAKAVGAFVSNCFAAEATIVTGIDAGTVTTKTQIDTVINAVS